MESWVGTLLKDIKEKVVLSAPSSATINPLLSLLSKHSELEVASTTRTETETVSSIDYFPFRLLPPELQLLINYVNQMRLIKTSHNLINILGRLLFLEHLASERASSAPCLEFDMSKMGHACITALLGERAWPPEGGYSFICWFQCVGLNSLQTEHRGTTKLRLFSVGSTNSENTFSEELYLQENGQLTLVINNTSQLSCPSLELEEGKWYHLAVVQSRKDSVAAEQFSGVVYTYLNGKLIDASELAYTPKRVEMGLQITIGTPANNARVSDLKWRLRSCYLFIEPLSSEFIYFMYMLVRGCKVLRQGSNNSESNVSVDARGGIEKFVLLDSSSDSAIQMLETSGLLKTPEEDYSGIIKDLENLDKLWLELCGKKLLCAFNAARIEAMPTTQTLALLNLVDPELAIASPSDRGTTCVPCFGHLYGDVSICRRCIIGNVISPVTGIAIILALIEHAETSNMLHLALTLLASTLHRNYHAVQHMKACHGYHLLSLFLQRKKSLFDSQYLDILFKIAVSEDPLKPSDSQTTSRTAVMPLITSPEPYTIDQDNLSTAEYDENLHCFSKNGETSSHEFQPLANSVAASSFSGALSDADILEHVLLDWTLWLTLPVSFQLKILNFFENLISVYMYKDHNLTVLRERNIVQHLLAGLHRDDFEVLVLEKLITLLAIILEHKFLGSELESVTNFVLTTFKPPEVMKPHQVTRETKSMRVTVRNILLETLIDLQVTICSEELLEQWHTLVSSKLVTYFLDESVHPTSMIWIITFLGLCLTSSATFALKFENGEGYQALARVLPSFRDFLDIRYTLFCLIFGKPIYPKLPEVGVLDFEALMLNSEDFGNLRFAGLLDSVVSMVKSVFDQLRVQPKIAGQSVNPSETSAVDLVEGDTDTIEELGEECSMNKMHDTSLLGWEASAVDATSVLKLMANLAKMSPSFSRICARTEFLEICVDLYFSIVRAYMAFKLTKEHNVPTSTNYAILDIEGNELPSTTSDSQTTSSEDSGFLTTSHLLLEIDNSGHSGETTSVGATTILDLIAEVLSVIMIEHANPVAIMEDLLVSVPLYLDSESALTFQALCLGRVMNYLERRLLYGDEKTGQSFDKNKLWSNLGSFCNLIVDRVYLGVFPQPSAVLRVLEFCLSMLHSAKKDSKIEESSLPWTGLLSVLRGSKPLDIILECTNRMILHCFHPSLPTIRENPLILQDERRVNISIVLELIHAHKDIIFHPGNVNTDLYCSLCINLIGLLSDEQTEARNSAMSILKYLLVHCRASLQEVLISKAENRKTADVLNGGFDKLLTENMSTFLTWFQNNEHDIKHVLQQYASIRWSQFIAESEKFRRDRLVSLEDHWTAKMGGKVELASKVDRMYWVQYTERRSALAAIQRSVCTEFDVLYQKKNELVVHAESEWRSRFEQLGHEHKNDLISSLVWEDYWPL